MQRIEGRLSATRLRCEHALDPFGVNVARPRLSWTPVAERRAEAQRAYQVIVSSSPELLTQDVGDRWDSGRVESDVVEGVPYAGEPLASRERCWWKVRLWDRDGAPGEFSPAAQFELGLLAPEDWEARWIGAAAGISSPLLRCEFELSGVPVRARAYVCGLGYHELYLNGGKVGDHVLDPATTTYDREPDLPFSDEMHPRALYAIHDVAGQLVRGSNVVGAMLGHGWWSTEPGVAEPPTHHTAWADRQRLLLQLEVELEGGEVVRVCSDGGWKASAGPVVYNDYYDGERYDARAEQLGWDRTGFDDATWTPVAELAPIAGVMRAQLIPPIRVIETLAAVATTTPREGVTIVDFGQHITGWTRIAVRAARGTEITVRYGGRLRPNGELDDDANMVPSWEGFHEARQTDVYIAKGEGVETWEPRFTLHGFSAIEATGSGPFELEGAEAQVVHSALEPSGSFDCATPLLNQIHSNVVWTLRANYQGFAQDAPDRSERSGWLGEPGFNAEAMFFDYESLQFWSKWLDDLGDAQLANGMLPLACPLHWRGLGGYDGSCPDWKTAYGLMMWELYRFYGDRSLLERHYDGVRRYVHLLLAQCESFILTRGVGDHMEPQPDGTSSGDPQRTPVALTSTAWLCASVQIVADAARELGDAAAARRYDALAEKFRGRFNEHFLDAETGRYDIGTQTAQALPLWLGLVPAEQQAAVVRCLLEEIERDDGHLATGVMGTAALTHVLPEVGAADVMYDIATQTTFPSWGHQIANGATTVWETWGDSPPDYSLNMKIFISIQKFLYRDVAGIAHAAPGWREVRVRPRLTHRLAHARASVRTVRGEVAIDWRRDGDELHVALEIPATSTADVWLPAAGDSASVFDGDEPLGDVRRDGEWLRLALGGGSYQLRVGAR